MMILLTRIECILFNFSFNHVNPPQRVDLFECGQYSCSIFTEKLLDCFSRHQSISLFCALLTHLLYLKGGGKHAYC